LIELVLVISLVGILALVTVPRFEAYYGIRLAAAVKTLAADIHYAQSRAVAERVRYGVAFDPSSESYTVYRGEPGTPASDPLHPGRPLRRVLEGIDLVSVSFDGGSAVEFDALGTPWTPGGGELSTPGTVVLAGQGSTDTLRVDPLGGRVEF